MEKENMVVIPKSPRKASDASIIAFTFMIITCGLNLIFGIGSRIFGMNTIIDFNWIFKELGITLTSQIYRILIDCLFFLPLFWQIPMTVYYRLKTKEGANVDIKFAVCSLIFVNIIGGIFMLDDVRKEEIESGKATNKRVEKKEEISHKEVKKQNILEKRADESVNNKQPYGCDKEGVIKEKNENNTKTETTEENGSSEDDSLNQENKEELKWDEDGVIKEDGEQEKHDEISKKEVLFSTLTNILNDTFIIEKDEPLSKYTNNELGDTVVDFACISSKTGKNRLFVKLIDKEDPNTIYKQKVKVIQPNGLEEKIPFVVFKVDELLNDSKYVQRKIERAIKQIQNPEEQSCSSKDDEDASL